MNTIDYITSHWSEIITALTSVIIAARIIVKLTPTPKDDTFLESIIQGLKHIGLVVKDKVQIVLAVLCMLSLTSCAFLESAQGKQMVVSLEQLGVTAAVDSGKLSPGDAIVINEASAVLTSGDSTMSKVVSLGSLGLDTAANKSLIAPGDVVLIKDAGAIITKAVTTPKNPLPPVTP